MEWNRRKSRAAVDGDSYGNRGFECNLKEFHHLLVKNSRDLNFGTLEKTWLLGKARILNA